LEHNCYGRESKVLESYLKRIHETASHGDAREESYYSVLKILLEEYAESTNRKHINVTILPKKTEAGNPDFRIWDGKQHIVGYIEAKPMTTEYLDQIETSEQLKRYLSTFPNVIVTNFFEFRLYRNGSLIDKVQIARPFVITKLSKIPKPEKEPEFHQLLEKFLSFSLPKVYNAKTLAIELAKRTRFLRDEVVAEELRALRKGYILGFYEAFKQYLIGGLSKEDFIDLYSQTIAYGLFAARTRSGNDFNRKLAYDNIPQTIGILRDVFNFISLGQLPEQMEWIVDDISEVLAVTDVKNILHKYYHEGKGKDPVVHFYETFLAEYDPTTREKRGVYYTPESVVSYIVRSLHHILKEHFNRKDGFASETVTVLDPAAGTLTFLAEAAKLAIDEFVSKYGEGGKENFIKEHILKNFYAFELMMAPYAVGHLKMSFLLEELGYKLKKDDRFKLYLTNTLEMEELAQTELPGMASLSEESHLAGAVKKKTPILVILGNPPYSGISANLSEKYVTVRTKKGIERNKKIKTWIGNLIEDYKYVDGKHFGERKHWLQDDYVKFIRFAQWKIDQAGDGVLGFITNHSYLDNITFRGMRQSLMNSYNEIYILNVHGSIKKKEKTPNGSKDDNVFDIMQGIAIAFFIKTRNKNKSCKVYYSDIWGLREGKYEWLSQKYIKTTDWQELNPTSPYYFFIPRKEKGRNIYERYWQMTDIFNMKVNGIVTARDHFVIDFDKQPLKARIMMFRNRSLSDEVVREGLQLKENYMWRVQKVRKQLITIKDWDKYFTKILYRPFDERHIYFHDSVVWRTRKKVMRHMLQENMGIHTCRQISSPTWHHILATNLIADDCYISNKTRERGYLFPLYYYPGITKKNLFSEPSNSQEKESNINPKVFMNLNKIYNKKILAEDIFYFIYAILYSNIYRKKYIEFLKIEFPRIPFTEDCNVFNRMCSYGERLVNLHLLRSKELNSPFTKYQGKGDYEVEKVKYEKGRILINKNQYFENIEKEIWEYKIGSYQVCEKWLKDRKGKKLTLDDIKHYCKIVTTIGKTIEIQKDIDKIYPEVEKEVIEFEK